MDQQNGIKVASNEKNNISDKVSEKKSLNLLIPSVTTASNSKFCLFSIT